MAVNETHVMVIEWCLWTTALFLAGCRFSLHIHKRSIVLLVSDLWLLMALLDCTALIACDTATYRAGAMDIFMDAPEHVRKLRHATMYLFDFGLYLPKFSMLAFYTRIIPPTSPKMRRAMWAVIGFVATAATVAFFAITFWCGTNLSVNWTSDEENGGCSAFSTRPLNQLTWSLNIVSETFIFLLPLPMIRSLNMTYRREKAALMCMFFLGFLTILASVARFSVQDIVTNNMPMYILAMTEYATSLIIVSSLTLRPLLRKIYRVATESNPSSNPFSRSSRATRTTNEPKSTASPTSNVRTWRRSRVKGNTVYAEGSVGAAPYGSEVELTELGMGRIYKTEEISVTSVKEVETSEEKAKGSLESNLMG